MRPPDNSASTANRSTETHTTTEHAPGGALTGALMPSPETSSPATGPRPHRALPDDCQGRWSRRQVRRRAGETVRIRVSGGSQDAVRTLGRQSLTSPRFSKTARTPGGPARHVSAEHPGPFHAHIELERAHLGGADWTSSSIRSQRDPRRAAL